MFAVFKNDNTLKKLKKNLEILLVLSRLKKKTFCKRKMKALVKFELPNRISLFCTGMIQIKCQGKYNTSFDWGWGAMGSIH